MGVSCCLLYLPNNTQIVMVRSILAAVLLVTLVSSSPHEYQKKIFMKYAVNNMWKECIGEQAMDQFKVQWIKAAAKCEHREFGAEVTPIYIKPYPVDGGVHNTGYNTHHNVPYHVHQQRLQQQQTYNQQPFRQYQQPQYQQYQQVPQYQQYQQQPQYQGQQFRQPQYQGQGYQQPQPFYAPGYGFQPVNHNQVNHNQALNRQVRQANRRTSVQSTTNAQSTRSSPAPTARVRLNSTTSTS